MLSTSFTVAYVCFDTTFLKGRARVQSRGQQSSVVLYYARVQSSFVLNGARERSDGARWHSSVGDGRASDAAEDERAGDAAEGTSARRATQRSGQARGRHSGGLARGRRGGGVSRARRGARATKGTRGHRGTFSVL